MRRVHNSPIAPPTHPPTHPPIPQQPANSSLPSLRPRLALSVMRSRPHAPPFLLPGCAARVLLLPFALPLSPPPPGSAGGVAPQRPRARHRVHRLQVPRGVGGSGGGKYLCLKCLWCFYLQGFSLTATWPADGPRVGSGGVRYLTDRVGSGRVGSGRVGSGWVGSGRVGSGRVGSGRIGSSRIGSRIFRVSRGGPGPQGAARRDPTREESCSSTTCPSFEKKRGRPPLSLFEAQCPPPNAPLLLQGHH